MVQEFKDFINKGNVVDLAVAVVIGAAFGLVIASFVDDVLMQIVAAIFGQPDFASITIHWGDPTVLSETGAQLYENQIFIGSFINSVINFLIVALAVFVAVKVYNRMQAPAEEEEAGPSEVDLLAEIRDTLKSNS